MYGPLGKTSLWQPQGKTGRFGKSVCKYAKVWSYKGWYVQILYNSEPLTTIKLARYLFDVSANLAEVLICYLHLFQWSTWKKLPTLVSPAKNHSSPAKTWPPTNDYKKEWFVCKYYSKQFCQNSDLKLHVKRIHLDQCRYQCPKCSKGFKSLKPYIIYHTEKLLWLYANKWQKVKRKSYTMLWEWWEIFNISLHAYFVYIIGSALKARAKFNKRCQQEYISSAMLKSNRSTWTDWTRYTYKRAQLDWINLQAFCTKIIEDVYKPRNWWDPSHWSGNQTDTWRESLNSHWAPSLKRGNESIVCQDSKVKWENQRALCVSGLCVLFKKVQCEGTH